MTKLTPQHQALLAQLARSSEGKALKVYLDELLEEVGDVTKCKSWEDTLGRKHAKEFLIESFRFLDKPELGGPSKNMYT